MDKQILLMRAGFIHSAIPLPYGAGRVADAAIVEIEKRDERIAELEKELAIFKAVHDDILCLMDESYGVIGLHLNGDVEPWEGLLPGGRFEGWLSNFPETRPTPEAQ